MFFLTLREHPIYSLFPYTTLFRSAARRRDEVPVRRGVGRGAAVAGRREGAAAGRAALAGPPGDRKSTRLNSSHVRISYAVFCLKKKKNYYIHLIYLLQKKIHKNKQ